MKFEEIIQSHPTVLVDFSATWCGPCKALHPILVQVKQKLGTAVKIVKIDVDQNPKLAAKYQVQGVPTLILYKNGKQTWRQSGVVPAAQLEKIITA